MWILNNALYYLMVYVLFVLNLSLIQRFGEKCRIVFFVTTTVFYHSVFYIFVHDVFGYSYLQYMTLAGYLSSILAVLTVDYIVGDAWWMKLYETYYGQ